MWVTPEHPSLSVIVDEHRGVDIVPMFLLPYKRFAKRVFERSVRRVCHQHANTMSVERCIEIELAITLDSLNSPSTILSTTPFEVAQRCHSTMVCPVHHVGGGPEQPVIHEETSRILLILIGNILGVSIVGSVEEQGISHQKRRRICCVFTGEEWHVALLDATELPPIEVHDFHAFSSMENKVEVMYTDHRCDEVCNHFLPLFPTTSVSHFQAGNLLTCKAVNAHVDAAATKC